jgi:hypothetical protein
MPARFPTLRDDVCTAFSSSRGFEQRTHVDDTSHNAADESIALATYRTTCGFRRSHQTIRGTLDAPQARAIASRADIVAREKLERPLPRIAFDVARTRGRAMEVELLLSARVVRFVRRYGEVFLGPPT